MRGDPAVRGRSAEGGHFALDAQPHRRLGVIWLATLGLLALDSLRDGSNQRLAGRRGPPGVLGQIGVGVLNVPFTLPAASAKRRRGLDAPRALLPALLAVAPVMWASQDATVPRTDAEAGPISLGSLCWSQPAAGGSRSAKPSDG